MKGFNWKKYNENMQFNTGPQASMASLSYPLHMLHEMTEDDENGTISLATTAPHNPKHAPRAYERLHVFDSFKQADTSNIPPNDTFRSSQ